MPPSHAARGARLVLWASVCAWSFCAGFKTADETAGADGILSPAAASCASLLGELAALGDVQRAQIRGLRATESGLIVSRGENFPTQNPQMASDDDYHSSTHVLLTLPRWTVLTVSELRTGVLAHFLKAPGFLEGLDRQRLRTSALFVQALFVLYQEHARGKEHAEPIWQAWLGCHRARKTAENALVFWDEGELEVVEEERLILSARDFKASAEELYTKLMQPLLEQFPFFFPDTIDLNEFTRAVQLAASQRIEIAGIDGEALTPLPIREAPVGSVAVEEVVEELIPPEGVELAPDVETEELLVNFVSSGGATLPAEQELIIDSGRRNDLLMLEAGYVWDDVNSASMPLRMWAGAALAKPDLRKRLLRRAKLNETQDFILTHGALPSKLWLWGRITLADAEELSETTTIASLSSPLSEKTEEAISSNFLTSMEKILSGFDHGIEEDDYILGRESGTKATAQRNRKPSLPLKPRTRLAVVHRRLSKRVLVDAMTLVAKEFERVKESFRLRPKASPSGYSTKGERKAAKKAKARRAKRD